MFLARRLKKAGNECPSSRIIDLVRNHFISVATIAITKIFLSLLITDKLTYYKAQALGHCFSKLHHIPSAEDLAYKFLQLEPRKRVTAQNALREKFFCDMPSKLFDLSPRECYNLHLVFLHWVSNPAVSFLVTSRLVTYTYTEASVFTVKGVKLYTEPSNYPVSSVIRAAARLKR